MIALAVVACGSSSSGQRPGPDTAKVLRRPFKLWETPEYQNTSAGGAEATRSNTHHHNIAGKQRASTYYLVSATGGWERRRGSRTSSHKGTNRNAKKHAWSGQAEGYLETGEAPEAGADLT